MFDYSRDRARKLDVTLAPRAEIPMIVSQLVQNPECQVQSASVEDSLLAAKLIEQAFEVVRQLADRHKPHHHRRALDAVEESKRFLKRFGILRFLLEAQEGIVQAGDLLVGLVEI